MHSSIPNFGAVLLHKKGYGYDVSGDVTDDKQLNIRDVNYRGVQPNPQENMGKPPDEKTLSAGILLYFGTTKKAWGEQIDTMLLFNSPKSALLQAQLIADSGTYKDPGLVTDQDRPIVLCTKFHNLEGLQLGPDPNTGFSSWQESFDRNGSFVAASNHMDLLKSKFKLVSL